MENTQDIKRRIQAVLNIKHVANAVKLISSIKLSKLKQSILNNVIENKRVLQDMLSTIISELEFDNKLPDSHFIKLVYENKSLLIVLSTEQGAFDNSVGEVLSKIKQYTHMHDPTYIELFGKKVQQTLQKSAIVGNNTKRNMDSVKSLTNTLYQLIYTYILNYHVGKIDIISCKLKNQVTAEVVVTSIMPFPKRDILSFNSFEFISPLDLINTIFSRYIYASCLNIAQDHILANLSVHVFTTDKIVRNSDNISKELKLLYNRIRQTKITQELTEIVASVESLK